MKLWDIFCVFYLQKISSYSWGNQFWNCVHQSEQSVAITFRASKRQDQKPLPLRRKTFVFKHIRCAMGFIDVWNKLWTDIKLMLFMHKNQFLNCFAKKNCLLNIIHYYCYIRPPQYLYDVIYQDKLYPTDSIQSLMSEDLSI